MVGRQVEVVLRCELSGWQKKLYKIIHEKSIGNQFGGITAGTGGGGGMNNVIMQLRKVCNHPYLFLQDWLIDEDLIRASGKFELLNRMLPKLRAAGHRVLIFSQMTLVMTILEKFFDMRGLAFLRLDGGTSADEREKRCGRGCLMFVSIGYRLLLLCIVDATGCNAMLICLTHPSICLYVICPSVYMCVQLCVCVCAYLLGCSPSTTQTVPTSSSCCPHAREAWG